MMEGIGMTGKAIGVQEGGRRWFATSHPPPNLPPKRGEGCIGGMERDWGADKADGSRYAQDGRLLRWRNR